MNHPAKILCLCLLMGIQSSAQIDKKVTYSHRVMYDYTFQPDSVDESLKISGDMILLLGKDYSNFMAYETYLADSVMLALRESGTAHLAGEAAMSTSPHGQRLSRPRINFELFKDYKSYFQYLTNRFGVHHAEYVDLLQTPDWGLADDDSSVIAGYKCKKAITRFAGRDYIAWYTKELAMNGGPYKFHGLPGLVLLV